MIAPLYVFAVRDSQPEWLGSSRTLVQAVEMIEKTGPGEYLVFSQVTHNKNLYKVSRDGTVSLVAAQQKNLGFTRGGIPVQEHC